MLNIQLLTSLDIVEPEDWCRPLSLVTMSGGHSDYYSFESMGAPCNNVKWVKVKYILGKCWHNKSVRDIHRSLGKYCTYEFMRGMIPHSHQLELKNYNITDYSKWVSRHE